MNEKKLEFFNPEHITEQEVIEILKLFPIDFARVKGFMMKEPGIKEAFLQYSLRYLNEFGNILGIELRPNVYIKLQEILLTCLTVGYLTRENLFNTSLTKCLKGEE